MTVIVRPITRQARRCEAWATVLLGILVLVLLLIPLRVGQLQLYPDEQLASAAGRTQSTAQAMAHRGDVLDRRGRVLATSTVGWRVFADPVTTTEPGLIGAHLGAVLDLDPADIPEGKLWIVVDDDGSGGGMLNECNEDNNEMLIDEGLCQ